VSPSADRLVELVIADHVHFGPGAIGRLPRLIEDADGSRAFIVTDPGVRGSGVVDQVLGILAAAGIPTGVFAEVEPNPGASTVERGAAALRAFGTDGTIVVPVGGGSAMDTAKALSLRSVNDAPVWELGYDNPGLTPGRPLIAVRRRPGREPRRTASG